MITLEDILDSKKFIAFLKKKAEESPNGTYKYHKTQECAIAQYLKSRGANTVFIAYQKFQAGFHGSLIMAELPKGWNEIVSNNNPNPISDYNKVWYLEPKIDCATRRKAGWTWTKAYQRAVKLLEPA